MNRKELVRKMSRDLDFDVTQKTINKVLDSFTRVAFATFKNGERVSIDRLGTFTPKERQARFAKHPLDPSVIYQIPPDKYVRFTLCKELDEKLNGKETENEED